MFRFLVKFLRILAIACLIGVSLRVIDVLILKEKVKKVEIDNTINEIQYQETLEMVSDEENIVENMKKGNQENDIVEIPKETDTNIKGKSATIEKKENIKVETKVKKEERQASTNKQTLPETTTQKPEETKQDKQTENKYTEVKVDIAKKKECKGNNHGIEVGNSGKWFNTKDEAITTYKAEIKKWGEKWTDKNNQISDEEYYKNCPYGYEVWSCMYCGKWTLNYYYDK